MPCCWTAILLFRSERPRTDSEARKDTPRPPQLAFDSIWEGDHAKPTGFPCYTSCGGRGYLGQATTPISTQIVAGGVRNPSAF
jgi:hypothetical protein